MSEPTEDRLAFEDAIRSLHAELANAGAHVTVDAHAREIYARQVRRMADELRAAAQAGRITWQQAAEEASEARNLVMRIVRTRTSPVGRAMAQKLKMHGRTLNELVARKTAQRFGPSARFDRLTPPARETVFADIVRSAGKADPEVTAAMRRMSRAGRGLIVVSVGLSIYNIVVAEDKVSATGREFATTGAGIAGGVAGGALAGLACGPGAPVCVTIGAFVGGAIAAIGVDLFW